MGPLSRWDGGQWMQGAADAAILVERLQAGGSIFEAARDAGVSVRTAHRRLALLRDRFGVATNAQLLRCVGTRECFGSADPERPPDLRAMPLSEADVAELISRLRGPRQPAVVVGPSGVGRSTLLWSCAEHFGGRVFNGAGLSSLRWMSYLPLISAVGRPPVGADAAGVARHVIDAVRDSLLVLDDLQWADPSTLAVLPIIATRVRVLMAVRTDERGSDAAEAAARACGAQLIRLTARHEEPALAALLARVATLPLDERFALARLALVGHPAECTVVGGSVSALVEAGLVREFAGQVQLRHDRIGVEVLASLDPVARRAVHRELAERLPTGEAARHHIAAGDVAVGREAALRAADAAGFPSERARNLLLAAGPGGTESDAPSGVERDLVLRAADAFLEAGETAEVQRVLDRFDRSGPNPDVDLRRARLCWQEGDPEGAHAAAARGLEVARGTDTAVEVGLRLEELKHVVRVQFDGARAIALAAEAHRLACALGTDRTQALTTLGSAHLVAGTGEWSTYLEAAIARAALDREPEAGLEASNAFIAAHMLAGDRVVARRGAARAARIAQRTGRRRWEEQFTITTNFLALLAGRCSSVALWGRDFVQPGLTTAVHIAYAAYALALADLGSNREALRVVAEGRAIDVGDDTGRSLLRWAEAETHWLGGCSEQALESAELCIAAGGSHFPSVPLAQAVRAWAQYDLGVMPQVVESDGWAFADAAKSDSQGVVALGARRLRRRTRIL